MPWHSFEMYQKIRTQIKLEWGDQDVSIGPGFPQIILLIIQQIICHARNPLTRSILQGSEFFANSTGNRGSIWEVLWVRPRAGDS